jgi:hypothetical protein
VSAADRLERSKRQRARRDRRYGQRQITVTREGRCQFCGQWTTPTNGGHTTFARLALGDGLCTGKAKGPYRIQVSITKNGLNLNSWSLTPGEQSKYADVVKRLTTRVKDERGARASEWVPRVTSLAHLADYYGETLVDHEDAHLTREVCGLVSLYDVFTGETGREVCESCATPEDLGEPGGGAS